MSPALFWSLTLREFILAQQGYVKQIREQEERDVHNAWLLAKLQRAKDIPKLNTLLGKQETTIEEVRAAKKEAIEGDRKIQEALIRGKWLKDNYGI